MPKQHLLIKQGSKTLPKNRRMDGIVVNWCYRDERNIGDSFFAKGFDMAHSAQESGRQAGFKLTIKKREDDLFEITLIGVGVPPHRQSYSDLKQRIADAVNEAFEKKAHKQREELSNFIHWHVSQSRKSGKQSQKTSYERGCQFPINKTLERKVLKNCRLLMNRSDPGRRIKSIAFGSYVIRRLSSYTYLCREVNICTNPIHARQRKFVTAYLRKTNHYTLHLWSNSISWNI